MMRIRFLPLLGIAFTAIKGPVLQTMRLHMEIGPFDKKQENPLVEYSITSTYNVGKTIYEIFRFGDNDNPNQQTVTKANHTVDAGDTYVGYVTFPTKTLFDTSGMKITVEVYLSSGTKISTVNCYIYPKSGKFAIDPTKVSSYTCPQTRAIIDMRKVTYPEESYVFSKVDDYFLTDLYYRLPFEQFEMETTLSESEFKYRKAYLKVLSMEEYFPSLLFLQSTATIPLSVDYDEGHLSLSIKDNLYVEPKLLQMSLIPKEGYVPTKQFYLPINHSKELVGASFILGIEGMGFNDTTLIWECSLLAESQLIGSCHNSGYCVVGTVTK